MAEATEALPQSQPSHCYLPLFVTVEAFNPQTLTVYGAIQLWQEC